MKVEQETEAKKKENCAEEFDTSDDSAPVISNGCRRSACRIAKLKWKMGKEIGGKKRKDPHSLQSNEMAQCSFQPQQPHVCDSFKNCEVTEGR